MSDLLMGIETIPWDRPVIAGTTIAGILLFALGLKLRREGK
jgi:hypothetical protein